MNLLLGCKEENVEEDVVAPVMQDTIAGLNLRALYSENHVIPVSEASEIALKAPELFVGEYTRANAQAPRVIESIGVYGKTNSSLKSANTNEDTLVYVFNFEDNRGFAIVAADDRIPTQLLAYVDEGVLENDVNNPGLQYALEQMQYFVESAIDDFERSKDSLMTVAEGKSFVVDAKIVETRAIHTGTVYYYLSESIVGPLIKVAWGQGYPYNMNVDKTCEYDNVYRGKAPVGCVATATAQIMSYWKYPSKVNLYDMNWNNMCSNPIPATIANQINIARLMIEIDNEVDMNFECDGSGAKPSDAYDFLGRIGYNKYFSKKFNSSDAKNAIDLKFPLLIKGCGTNKITGKLWWKRNHYSDCHVWVIDGYKAIHYKQENYRIDTNTGKYTSTISYIDDIYFHNNWGYEGNCNGYFAAGCFNMNDAYNYDGYHNLTDDFHYSNEMFCVYR